MQNERSHVSLKDRSLNWARADLNCSEIPMFTCVTLNFGTMKKGANQKYDNNWHREDKIAQAWLLSYNQHVIFRSAWKRKIETIEMLAFIFFAKGSEI